MITLHPSEPRWPQTDRGLEPSWVPAERCRAGGEEVAPDDVPPERPGRSKARATRVRHRYD
jgi:hypothetical protein